MKHTKIYQARIQRTFITTMFHVFLGLSEHGKFPKSFPKIRKYATNDHTSTKNYKKSGCFNSRFYFVDQDNNNKITKIGIQRILMTLLFVD